MAEEMLPDDTQPVIPEPAQPEVTNQPAPPPVSIEPEPPARRGFWRRTWVHWVIGIIIIAGLGAAAGLPVSRYWILNHARVRSAVSLTLVDDITQQPLQHVRVSVAGVTSYSDSNGKAVLHGLMLGPATLVISQPGFSEVHQQMVVGWGSNPFDVFKLKAIGVPYRVKVTDWLSGKPISGVQVESDTATARSDSNGTAVLILPNTEATDDIAVTVAGDGYRNEAATVKAATTTPVPIALVTSRKAVYISKQSGAYDLYASDADGQNKQVLLPGTGNEGVNMSLAVSPDGTQAALVSTRDKQFDADGYPLSTLTLVDIATGNSIVLTHADQIQLIDWVGSRLVFEQAASSGADRFTITSYDYATTSRYQLAAAARFNSVLGAQGMVYYAVAPSAGDPSVQPYFYRVNSDGTGKQTLLEKEVWSVYRTGYDTFSLQTGDTWYTHAISTKRNTATTAPDVLASTLFAEQPGQGGNSLWVNTKNGPAALTLHNKVSGKATVLHAQGGLAYPVRWLTADSAIFRIVTGGETADYAVGTTANRPVHKIADVTNTFGFSAGQ